MKKIIFIIFSFIIFLSCRGSITSPPNSGGSTTEPTEPPITQEDLNKYGLEIDTATAENIREALEKYYNDKGEYKLIFKGVSTEVYTRYSNLGTIIDEIKDITDIIVSLENVTFQNNRLPDNILGSTSFNNNNITKVILHDDITALGNEAFINCYVLAEVNMPKRLIEIGSTVFDSTKIKNIDLPNELKIINNYAFRDSIIESIIMPDSVISIGEAAFELCPQLHSVKLSKNLSVIPKSAFASCYELKSIIIPESVTSIEDIAFYVCKTLEKV